MKCLRQLKRWDRGFEFHLRHGCLFSFILCLYQVAALRWAYGLETTVKRSVSWMPYAPRGSTEIEEENTLIRGAVSPFLFLEFLAQLHSF
jgi:hypothetical protein